MPIWVDYMQTALKGVPEEKPRPARTASSSRTANTISRNSAGTGGGPPGLPQADTLGEFLNGLGGGGEDNSIKVRGVGAQGNAPWSQKIPF